MDMPLKDSNAPGSEAHSSGSHTASAGFPPFDPEAAERLLRLVAEGLLDRPDRVAITTKRHMGEITLVMHVPADEINRIIGEHGRTVRSLRTFFSALSARHGIRILLEVVEV